MTARESDLVTHPRKEHLVQLFDDSDSRAAAVARFVSDGLRQGDSLVVVMTADNWNEAAARLKANGAALERATESGQLLVHDAATALTSIMCHGKPLRDLFARTIGTLVSQLNSQDRHLRIYGEIVDLLAAEGNYRSAQLLEELWNELGERESFTLFCGYSAVNFGDPDTGDALRQICRCHSHVLANPRDVLGTFLLHARAGETETASHLSH